MRPLLLVALLASGCFSQRAKVGTSFASRPTIGGREAVTATLGMGVGKTLMPLRSLYFEGALGGRLSKDSSFVVVDSVSYVDAKTLSHPFRVEARFGFGTVPHAMDESAPLFGIGMSMLLKFSDENLGGGSDHGWNDIKSDYRQFSGLGFGIDIDRVIGDAHATIVTLNLIADRYVVREGS